MVASPNNGGFYDTGYTTTSPEMRFLADIRQAGAYYVWIRAWADSGTDDSAHIGLDDQATASADRIYPATLGAWVWTRSTMDGPVATLNVTTPGVHVVNIWAREDGMYIDKIVLTTSSSYTPSGTGPAESVRGPVYVYDGDGNRVRSVESGSVTAYVGSWYESVRVPGDATPKANQYYYAGSQRLAMRKEGELYFLVGDHLGSTSLSYKAGGSDTDTQTYKAWGELRWPTTSALPTDRTYTGQHSEVEGIGLLYYGARWYDPALSRWAQPDSIIPNPFNPLDWDRFAYVRSNPVRYSDPSGHFTKEEVCSYWGYCTKEEAQKGLKNLFPIIYDTDITWGDLLIYKNEEGNVQYAMFVLFAQEIGGRFFYSAGLWSVNGGHAVAWDDVAELPQLAGYGYDEKKGTSRVRVVGMDVPEFFGWFGGVDPQLQYTVDDLWYSDSEDYGTAFALYVDLNGLFWGGFGAAGIGAAGEFGLIALAQGLARTLAIFGVAIDIGGLFELAPGPVDNTFPAVYYDPLIPGRSPWQLHWSSPKGSLR